MQEFLTLAQRMPTRARACWHACTRTHGRRRAQFILTTYAGRDPTASVIERAARAETDALLGYREEGSQLIRPVCNFRIRCLPVESNRCSQISPGSCCAQHSVCTSEYGRREKLNLLT